MVRSSGLRTATNTVVPSASKVVADGTTVTTRWWAPAGAAGGGGGGGGGAAGPGAAGAAGAAGAGVVELGVLTLPPPPTEEDVLPAAVT